MNLKKMKIGESRALGAVSPESDYEKQFKTKLDNWDVNSPAELEEKEKSVFFDEVKDENFATTAAMNGDQIDFTQVKTEWEPTAYHFTKGLKDLGLRFTYDPESHKGTISFKHLNTINFVTGMENIYMSGVTQKMHIKGADLNLMAIKKMIELEKLLTKVQG